MENTAKPKSQNIYIADRSSIKVTGVTDVISFDEYAVSMSTESGELTVEGEGLHISELSLGTGEIAIEGKLWSLSYSDGATGKRRADSFGERNERFFLR